MYAHTHIYICVKNSRVCIHICIKRRSKRNLNPQEAWICSERRCMPDTLAPGLQWSRRANGSLHAGQRSVQGRCDGPIPIFMQCITKLWVSMVLFLRNRFKYPYRLGKNNHKSHQGTQQGWNRQARQKIGPHDEPTSVSAPDNCAVKNQRQVLVNSKQNSVFDVSLLIPDQHLMVLGIHEHQKVPNLGRTFGDQRQLVLKVLWASTVRSLWACGKPVLTCSWWVCWLQPPNWKWI